ncbi:MAG: alkaline phosphatase D family protein [Pacificimonas sp.]
MSLTLRRRHFLAAGLGGAAALTLPGSLLAATIGKGFTHGVASGEPQHDSVLIWTRHVGAGDETRLSYELAEDPEFGHIVTRGETLASVATGHCAKAIVTGLDPARWYYFRFRAPNGTTSDIGRTRTLPESGLDPFVMAVMSCSNLPFGFFNAYAHAAAREDVHLSVHLGDYLYEYELGNYPSEKDIVAGREVDPAGEIVTLDDYHRRYAVYRADPDLQRLHQVRPMITIWDDHEFTNDAWVGGAQNHQPETEGDWQVRKEVARAAYRHWMPVSDDNYRAYEIGDLATLFRLDTRVEGRDEQVDVARIVAETGSFPDALQRIRDQDWSDPARSMMGAAQEAWLSDGLSRSTRDGKRWQVLAQQVLVGEGFTPLATTEWIDPAAPAFVQQRIQAALGLAEVGIPANLDAWGGYPAARQRLLSSAQAADANLVVLAGDSHNSWAFDLAEDGAPAGVEFGVSSVTSPGFEAYFNRTDPKTMAAAMIGSSPELKWMDASQRGYGVVTLAADEARCDWTYVNTIKRRDASASIGGTQRVRHGMNILTG